mmetsp:Transcript_55569/g.178279  ORF Transcript_55569/g.178279 Transcript_55569/m.178279 type:complete len:277 (-) Transcript_55569:217-1047(-)
MYDSLRPTTLPGKRESPAASSFISKSIMASAVRRMPRLRISGYIWQRVGRTSSSKTKWYTRSKVSKSEVLGPFSEKAHTRSPLTRILHLLSSRRPRLHPPPSLLGPPKLTNAERVPGCCSQKIPRKASGKGAVPRISGPAPVTSLTLTDLTWPTGARSSKKAAGLMPLDSSSPLLPALMRMLPQQPVSAARMGEAVDCSVSSRSDTEASPRKSPSRRQSLPYTRTCTSGAWRPCTLTVKPMRHCGALEPQTVELRRPLLRGFSSQLLPRGPTRAMQ